MVAATTDRHVTKRPTTLLNDPISETDIATLVAFAEFLDDLSTIGPQLSAQIETHVGLRLGQIRILHAVADGQHTPRAITATTGEHLDAITATLRSLAAADLLTHPDERSPERYDLTEAGRVRLDQFLAVQLRCLSDLPASTSRRMLTTLRVLAARLTEAGHTTYAGPT